MGANTIETSAVLIVRNEARCLAECLAALEGVVDEIVVTDTGSTDHTMDIAAQFTDRCFTVPWRDDFAAARNFALDHARGTWALVVDADEVLDNREEARALLAAFIAEHGPEVAGEIEIRNLVGYGNEAREAVDHTTRFFERSHYRYAGAIHEQLIPTAGSRQSAATRVRVIHSGYAQPPGDPGHKAHRNLHLLQLEIAQHPDDEYFHFQAGKAHFSLHHWAEAAAAFERALQCIHFDHAAVPTGAQGPVSRKVLTALVTSQAYTLANLGRLGDADALLTYHGALGHPGTRRADFWYALGYVRLMLGAVHPAQAAYELALKCGPNDEDVRGTGSFSAAYQMGLLAEATQDLSGALEWYRRSLVMHPVYGPTLSRCIDFITEYGQVPPPAVLAAADTRALHAQLLSRLEACLQRHDMQAAGKLARAAAALDPQLAQQCRERLEHLASQFRS
jgi:tetratricopeptide (TPR) repeat protein